jgi:peptide/nickel transport system permease protein
LRKFIKRFARHRLGIIGAVILLTLGIVAVFAPQIAPYDPNEIDTSRLPKPGMPAPPSKEFLWGTDDLGRDYLSRAMYGSRISMSVGFISMGIATLVGTAVGAISGYFGGRIDTILMRIVDILLCFPTFFLVLTVQATLKPSLYNVMIIIGLTGWMHIARLVRAEFLSLREREFVEAARALGFDDFRIVFKHVLPNAMGPVIVAATLGIPGAILTESSLSFLGLGVQPPTSSWGSMLTKAQVYMRSAWWVVFYPGILISITVLSFNFLGDALRDALDPRSRLR